MIGAHLKEAVNKRTGTLQVLSNEAVRVTELRRKAKLMGEIGREIQQWWYGREQLDGLELAVVRRNLPKKLVDA